MPTETPKFTGVEVTAGGRTLVLPALTLGGLKRLRPEFDVISGLDPAAKGAKLTDEQVDAMTTIIVESAKRNYPEITPEEIEEFVDLGNIGPILGAILGASGFVKRSPGEVGSP